MTEDFLKAETRCDYYVSEDIKKLWAIEMDCLKQFIFVCNNHGLKYFAGGGTLLGAVRHRGFIPWDDDIDVFMLKEDYDKFCTYAAQEIKHPYFFQNCYTQHGFAPRYSRIRRSDTTGCTQYEVDNSNKDYNVGIFIDIFPLTYVAEGKLSLLQQKITSNFWGRSIVGYEKIRLLKMKNKLTFKAYLSRSVLTWSILKHFYTHEQLCEKYLDACTVQKSSKVGLVPFLRFREKYIWPSEYFDETVMLPFEDMEVSCPKEWDKVLEHQFGNYHVFDKGTAIHSLAVVDTEHSYADVMKNVWAKSIKVDM